jgi:predicted nucleic acid-binding protein
VLIDAGPIVAYLRRNDLFHEWSLEQFNRFPQFTTCDAVLAEACARLAYHHEDQSKVVELLNSKALRVSFDSNLAADRLSNLMRKYSNRPMDLADACLVVMSEQVDDSTVITLDRTDFSIYRRHDRELVPFIAPDQNVGKQ